MLDHETSTSRRSSPKPSTALIALLVRDSDAIKADQEDFLAEGNDGPRLDRDDAVRSLIPDVHMLAYLPGASQDTKVNGEWTQLVRWLDEMCRIVTERLAEQMQYAPLETTTVLELTERLRWAAEQPIRAPEPGEAVA